MKTPQNNVSGTTKAADENIAYAIRPENSLRKKIGTDVDIEKLLTPEKIQECQKIIEKAHVDLFEDALQNLEALEVEYTLANSRLTQSKPHIQKIANLSFVLKGRLEAIGLTLGSEVVKSIYEFSKSSTNATQEHMLVLRKHLDVLTIVLKEKTKGDGGAIGKEMLGSLSLLIKKME